MLRKWGGKSETGKRASSAQICSRVESSRPGSKRSNSPQRHHLPSLRLRQLSPARFDGGPVPGASDASAAVFDVQRVTDYVGGEAVTRHKCLFAVDKQHEHGHKYAVSSAVWYLVDTGLFVTGSYDHHINVWDTNTTQVVMDFRMPGKVQLLTCSLLPEPKMFKSASVILPLGLLLIPCLGHRDGVMTVEWSTSSEWVLLTGGCDGAIRFWDIKRAGCFHVLDQSQYQLGRRPPILERSATIKGSTVKSSSPSQSTSAKARAPQKKLTNGNGAKHSPIGKGPVKGSMKQRLHPGMLSSQDRATAHYGAVTGLKVTEDGMYLLSAGSDSRLRLWDIESGCNTLVNFETVRMQTSKPIQLATS